MVPCCGPLPLREPCLRPCKNYFGHTGEVLDNMLICKGESVAELRVLLISKRLNYVQDLLDYRDDVGRHRRRERAKSKGDDYRRWFP